ncbi:MAG: DEAD/DEAH box helicase family protein [Bacteriovoracales bacterium]|nr:DEAD/DEAH box helicase family protein [Bacteriovoracales bacterium]
MIDPKLRASGWFKHQWQLDLEYKIAAGRIHFDGKKARRAKPVYADYLLRYSSSKAIAIVEAKAENKHYLEGERQAKDYARKLGLWFAYSTNGHEIEFFNLKANTQTKVARFHTPDELWEMYLEESGLKDCPEQNKKAILHEYYDESGIGQRRRPRYYQEKAVNNTVESIIHGKKRILITMATGTGKTFTAIQLAYKLWSARVVKKILFIVDRNLLADQAFSDFEGAFPKDACYRLKPREQNWPKGRDLYFGIYQSLVGGSEGDEEEGVQSLEEVDRFKEFSADYFDLIVIDEAHRGARRSKDGQESSSWFRLLEYFDSAIQVGLTATPKRDESNHTYAHFGNPVVSYSLKEGIEDGYLAPYIIKRATTNIDALGYRPDSDDIEDVRGKILKVKDYFTPNFERELSIPQRTRAFAYHLLRHLFATDPIGKTIVFCVDQSHALDMAKYCKEAFLKYKEKYGLDEYKGDYAVRITGDDKDSRGGYPDLEKFKDLDSHQPVIVTTSKLLTTGIDVKNVKNIVIFRNVGSMVEFKQIIGRGTRTYEAKDAHREKLGFFILEYANYSTHLFNDPEWDDDPLDIEDDGTIEVDDTTKEGTGEPPIPTGDGESETDDGIYDEPDDGEIENIRYRMSEEFLYGQVGIAAEDTAIIGPNSKPISKDDFIIYQSEKIQERFANFSDLKKFWKTRDNRKNFTEDSTDMDIRPEILKSLFFEKHGLRNVDVIDIIGNLLYREDFLTKEERIGKAKKLAPKAFDLGHKQKNQVVEDILSIYQDTEHDPLSFPQEFWQIPQMRKYGGFSGVRNILGGKEATKQVVQGLETALYDERISA